MFYRLLLFAWLALLGYWIGDYLERPALFLRVDGARASLAPNGQRIAIGTVKPGSSDSSLVEFRSTVSGKPIGRKLELRSRESAVGLFSHDARYFGARDGVQFIVWDVDKSREIARCSETLGWRAVQLSNDGRRLLCLWAYYENVQASKTLWAVADTQTGEYILEGECPQNDFAGVALSGDGSRLALSTREGTALYEVPGGKRVKLIDEKARGTLITVHNGRWFSLGTKEGVQLYDYAKGRTVGPKLAQPGWRSWVNGLDSAGKRATTVAHGRDDMHVWEISSGKLLRIVDAYGPMSADGKLVAGIQKSKLTVTEIDTEKTRFELSEPEDILSALSVQPGLVWVRHGNRSRLEAWSF